MKVKFKTNLDKYDSSYFPENLTMPPRIGEKVAVCDKYAYHYSTENLPLKLEVIDVTWYEDYVTCELWYNKTDLERAKACHANVF